MPLRRTFEKNETIKSYGDWFSEMSFEDREACWNANQARQQAVDAMVAAGKLTISEDGNTYTWADSATEEDRDSVVPDAWFTWWERYVAECGVAFNVVEEQV